MTALRKLCRFESLRVRLTTIATAVVAIVLAATAVALVAIQEHQLTANLDASLQQRADTLAAQFLTELPSAPLVTNDEDRAIQLVGTDGTVLATSGNLVGQPALDDASTVSGDVVATRDDLPLEDDTYRVLSRRVETPAGTAVLHVAENSDDLNESVTRLIGALTLVLPAVVGLLAALTWWLTGRTLRPVDAIRAEVEQISAVDAHRRVPVSTRRDEISRLATTMNHMLDRLDDAAERQRRFVADAAHELRTPLTRIRTEVEVDLAQPDTADTNATNVNVRDEVVEVQSLIDDLLHLARSDAGHAFAPHRPVDLDDIVLAEIQAQRATTATHIDAVGVSAAHVQGHPDQLGRAVRNLLTNAVRHANRAVVVTLAESDGEVELGIADDGPGVPTEHRDRIFERFARVDDSRTRTDGGTGLGLAITRDIIERHGGTVRYDAPTTSGARFVVSLPRPK